MLDPQMFHALCWMVYQPVPIGKINCVHFKTRAKTRVAVLVRGQQCPRTTTCGRFPCVYSCTKPNQEEHCEENKVLRLGAWLDEHIVGDGILLQCEHVDVADVDATNFTVSSSTTQQQKAHVFFCLGVKEFDVGSYEAAANWFQKAAAYSDLGSRQGGQYQLWTAQALHAAGKQEPAKNTLRQLKTHKDRDVRKASQQLLYILGAPALKLDASHFVSIPTNNAVFHRKNREKRKVAATTASLDNPLSLWDKARNDALVPKEPEKYTLEWFIQKEPPPPQTNSRMNTNLVITLATTIVISMLVFFYHG
jgi:hypothetical protein